jgi:hypothetical protein
VDIPSFSTLLARVLDGLQGLVRISAWVREAGLGVQAAIALFGILTLTVAGRAERALAGVGGAVAGALFALVFRSPIVLLSGLTLTVTVPLLAAIGGGLSAVLPRLFPFLAVALPAGLMGVEFPIADRPWLGGLVVAVVAGVMAAFLARSVGIILVSFVGGVSLAVAGLGLLGPRPMALAVAARPLVLCGLALVLGIAGSAFQLPKRRRGQGDLPPQTIEQPKRF